MKKCFFAFVAAVMALSVVATGCSKKGGSGAEGKAKIGVSMPTQSLQRWNQDGSNMKAQLEKAGYAVELQFGGDNDIPMQVGQIENMITGGVKALVIAAIDGSSLTEVLKQAKEKNIPVIAY
ncbi:MAG: substrate-binding domain-containing protein, partial [Spirochaetaceae bacterium]|nr:substrate-binding domain-containing protein [Spirochaetaceae bacterium]